MKKLVPICLQKNINGLMFMLFGLFSVLFSFQEAKGTVITIPTTPGTDSTYFTPTNRKTTFSASRMIFTASEIGTTGTVTELSFQKFAGSTSISINYITIYMKETTASTVSTTVPSGFPTGYTKVFNSGAIDNTMSSGWTTVTLSTAASDIFTYSGGSNNLDIVIVKTTSETATTNYPSYYCHTTASNMTAYYYGSSALGSSFTNTTLKRPNIKITIENTCAGKPSAGSVNGPTSQVCSGSNFTLSGTGITTGFGMKYQWQARNAGVGVFTNTGVADTFSSYTTNTTVNKDYRMISTCTLSGQSDTTSSLTVNVLGGATIAAGTDTVFCIGGGVVLSTTAVSGISYTWYKDAVSTGSTGVLYNATTSGVYNVRATTTDCPAGTYSNTKTVTVNPLPTASVLALSATTFCSGLDVVLQANTGSSLSYQWQKGGVNISGATSSSYTASASGAYRVIVTNTTTSCTNTSSAITVTVNPSPAAPVISGAGGATEYCASGSLVLSAIPTSGVSYQWEKVSGIIVGATTNSYTAFSPDTYRLAAILGSCSTKSNALTITENPLPVAVISPTGSVSFCGGDSINISATTSTDASYQWYESSTPISGATSSSYYAKTSGVYSIKVTNTTTGCKDQSASLTVNVITTPKPTISAASAVKFCDGGSVTLNAVVAMGMVPQWQESGIDIVGAGTPSLLVNTSGTYRMKVTSSVGCSEYSTPITVTVNPLPDNTLTITGGTNICDGDASVLLAVLKPGYTYQWRDAGVDIAGVTYNPYYAKTAGTYSVKIVDSNGCEAISTDVPVTVNHVAPFYIQPHGNTFFCDGEKTLLTTQNGFTTYQWFLNGVFLPGATDTFVYADKNGKYAVRVQDPTNGCFSTSLGFNIIVIPSPDTPYITKAGSRLSTSVKGVFYQWFKDGVAIAGATDSFINVVGSGGVYSVKVTNIRDCSNTAFIDLNPTSIAANVSQNYYIKLYPNPTSDILNIEAPEGILVKLTDIQGKVLYEAKDVRQIDMATYASGIYIVHFVDANGQVVAVQKVSKRD